MAAIGLFDSGLGGLSIVRELRARMPRADFVYVSDARHLPYGNKSDAFITRRAVAIGDYLLAAGCGALVVACNTATAAAIAVLRARYAVPVFGIEPAVKPASASTQSGVVGILATMSTLQSHKYAELVRRFGHYAHVIDQPCPGLVERIEAGDLDGPATRALLQQCIEPLLAAGADTLVLGCTHYPFVIDTIRALAGDSVRLIDPSVAVARHVAAMVPALAHGTATLHGFTSGDVVQQSALAARLLGAPMAFAPLPEAPGADVDPVEEKPWP